MEIHSTHHLLTLRIFRALFNYFEREKRNDGEYYVRDIKTNKDYSNHLIHFGSSTDSF